MYRIDHATGVTTLAAPTAPTATPDRYFFGGNPATGQVATLVEDEWLNMVQEELINAVVAGGLTPDKSERDQLARAIAAIASGAGPSLTGYATEIWVNGNFLPLAGGTVSPGPVSIGTGPGNRRALQFLTNIYNRWSLAVTVAAESGGNAGSNFAIERYNDAGAIIDSPIVIGRADGVVTIGNGGLWCNIDAHVGRDLTVGQDLTANRDVFARYVASGSLASPGAGRLRVWPGTGGGACYFGAYNANGVQAVVSMFAEESGVTTEYLLCRNLNATDFQTEPHGSFPLGLMLSWRDNWTNWYATTVDQTSDRRIKQNITESDIDALAIINAIQISQYDIRPEVSAWYNSAGLTGEARERMLANPPDPPEHVSLGIVADHLLPHIPEAVHRAPPRDPDAPRDPRNPIPDDVLTVAPQLCVPYLIRSVQQLSAEAAAVKRQLQAMQGASNV